MQRGQLPGGGGGFPPIVTGWDAMCPTIYHSKPYPAPNGNHGVLVSLLCSLLLNVYKCWLTPALLLAPHVARPFLLTPHVTHLVSMA